MDKSRKIAIATDVEVEELLMSHAALSEDTLNLDKDQQRTLVVKLMENIYVMHSCKFIINKTREYLKEAAE